MVFKDYSCYWNKQELKNKTPVLNKINLSIKPGSLNAVIGTIGCGKSSLFMALLREVPITEGELSIGKTQSIAYVEQDPVVFSGKL